MFYSYFNPEISTGERIQYLYEWKHESYSFGTYLEQPNTIYFKVAFGKRLPINDRIVPGTLKVLQLKYDVIVLI